MYPNSPTETEQFIKMIKDGSPKITETIQDYIDKHDTSKMVEGEDYYFKRNDITKRVIYKYDEAGDKTADPDATNNKLASGWHKILVDQKAAYLVGDPITIGSKSDKDIEPVTNTMGEEFDDTLPELVKHASNKGREWLHPFIDEEGNFDYIVIPAQEIIPIYDNSKRKNLDAVIRYYNLDDDTVKIELWDKDKVTYYEKTKNGEIVLDVNYDPNPAGHWEYGTDDKGWSRYGWGKVPFIEFKNNEERISDLHFYRDFIDAYDYLTSDTTNSLEDIQELFFVIKGYEDTSLAEFSTNLKRFKGVKVDSEGGVDPLQAEVPIESINSHLDRLIDNIFQFGQGVDVSTDKFGNSPSGVALKFLYSLLDMKASVLERKFSKALEQFVWFVCEYLSISGKGEFDYKDITFTFNKSMIMNEAETIDMLTKSNASTETKLENDPFVKDVEQEKDRLQKEQDEYMKNMEDIGGGEDE